MANPPREVSVVAPGAGTPARPRRAVRLATYAAVLALALAVLLAVGLLAAVHVDDRYGVGAASGVWMGLSAALRDGVLYPAIYSDGFYGGTRYMPLPVVLEAGAATVSSELLVSAKLLIYAVAVGLYALLYIVARRRGAPLPIAVGLVAAVLATAAGSMTTLGIRWDALATLFQLAAVATVVGHEKSNRRAAVSGLLCALALAAKISAVWAPITLVIWLASVARRSLRSFLASFIGSCVGLLVIFEGLSSGRLSENLSLFAFGGSDSAPALEGAERLYQFALRDQREGAILILLAGLGVVIAALTRRIGPYEIGLAASIAVLLVVMRDGGAYENHLLDLLVLASVVVAGMWVALPAGRARMLVQALVVGSILVGTLLAVRYTLVPDLRAAASHELRGKPDSRFAVDALGGSLTSNGCDLFEDASIPLLAGQRPVVLDAFMLHRLQTRRQAVLSLLDKRVEQRSFDRIVLTRPLTDVGWFAVLDFGSQLAGTMRDNYTLAEHLDGRGLWIYVPKGRSSAPSSCRRATVDQW